jgi:hypothetical protein
MVRVPVSVPFSHSSSNEEPAAMFWSWLGVVITAKPAVWAKAEEASATAAKIAEEKRIVIVWLVDIGIKNGQYQRYKNEGIR